MNDRLLVVGYGNTLRRDDALGCLVARHVHGRKVPSVRAVELHQLVPELASQIAETAEVIFVDASANGSGVAWHQLEQQSGKPPRMDHFSDPGWILHLCHSLYGRSPQASLMTISARDFDFGEGLSSEAETHLREAIRMIDCHIHRITKNYPTEREHPVRDCQEHG